MVGVFIIWALPTPWSHAVDDALPYTETGSDVERGRTFPLFFRSTMDSSAVVSAT